MSNVAVDALPAAFRGYPGVVLRLSRDGVVLASNGRLEAELGGEVTGSTFARVLDDASSEAKWRTILEAGTATTCELVLAGTDTLPEPRAFSVLPDGATGTVLLLEHVHDTRMDHLREQVTITNSELATAQRQLLKERGRLAYALDRLDAQNRETERLAAQVREQNVELRRSNLALDEFAHAVSHDLKAPLRAIANFARWVEEDAGGALPVEARSHLAALQQRAVRMRAMIDGVLDYARAGRQSCQPERVHVAAVVDDVLGLLDVPDDVSVTTSPPMPEVVTERPPLQQVLQNLVGNAVKFARLGGSGQGSVVISARTVAGGVWEFSVSDNGPGIPAEQQAGVWQLFRTADTLSGTNEGAGSVAGGHGGGDAAEGTGVGLAIVRMLVESRGGVVGLESRPGEGTTFRFTWPEETTG